MQQNDFFDKFKASSQEQPSFITKKFTVTPEEVKYLLRFRADQEVRSRLIVFLIGVVFSPLSLIGGLFGFVRSYHRFYRSDEYPDFYPMRPITRVAMLIGVAVIWVCWFIITGICFAAIKEARSLYNVVLLYFVVNAIISIVVFGVFRRWQIKIGNKIVEGNKFGTARFARPEELSPYWLPSGLYIGGGCYYSKNGHLLTIAGTRSGKFTNLIAPNLLGWGNIDGSYLIIDPKGEIASVTGVFQRSIGQNVVILNPWDLLTDHVGQAQSYNPLDILEITSIHLVDDCHMIAEMLVPVETGRNKFFSDSARAVITGFILYIAITKENDERTLTTLWKICRYPQTEWDRVLAEMENSDDELNGENLLYAASEIQKITQSGGNTWGSVLATILQATEFLKSPALQTATQSGFDPKTLANIASTVYVIIPADKLQSHSRWLRLVVTSTMRAVIRKPNKRVVFMLDEFAALGYLPEIEIALGTYAGFNVTIWPILQSLVQLQNLYKDNWQVFVANSAVRHFFGIHNNFDADYISASIGLSSHVITTKFGTGEVDSNATPRPLITSDELRVESGKRIFTFIDDLPATYFDKLPYYEVEELRNRSQNNPYGH